MSRVCFGDVQDPRTGVWECPRSFLPYNCDECREGLSHARELLEDERETE